MENACPIREPWFGKLMRVSKLRMVVIKNQYFEVISEVIKALLEGWDKEWRREGLMSRR